MDEQAELVLETVPPPLRERLGNNVRFSTPTFGATSQVSLVHRGGEDEPLVLKRCTRPPYTLWLEHDYNVLQALQHCDLPIPRAIDFWRAGSAVEDEVWMLMSSCPGTPLWTEVVGCDLPRRVELFKELGALLARVHGTNPPAMLVEARGLPELNPVLHRAASWVRRHPKGAPATPAQPERASRAMVHGDFTLDNVLCHQGALSVIDWGGASLGDPAWDISLALSTGPELRFEPEAVNAFFAGYLDGPLPVDVHDDICRRYHR